MKKIVSIIQKKLIDLQKLGFEVEEIKLPVDLLAHLSDLKNFILAKFETLAQEIPLIAKPILRIIYFSSLRRSFKSH